MNFWKSNSQVSVSLLLICIYLSNVINSHSTTTSIIDTKSGSVVYEKGKLSSIRSKNVYSIIGNSIHFPSTISTTNICAIVDDDEKDDEDCNLLITSPCATYLDSSSSFYPACVSKFAKSIVISGMRTSSDTLTNSRFGRTLKAIFTEKVRNKAETEEAEEGEKNLLILTLEGEGSINEKPLLEDLEALFDTCWLTKRSMNKDEVKKKLYDFYRIEILKLNSEEDALTVLRKAKEAASQISNTSIGLNCEDVVLDLVELFRLYKKDSKLLSGHDTDPPFIVESLLLCQYSYRSHMTNSNSKLVSWKNRVTRGLVIDKFGQQAMGLLKRTLDEYDSDTISVLEAAKLSSASLLRLQLREKLKTHLTRNINKLYEEQISNVESNCIQKFQSQLKKNLSKKKNDLNEEYDQNAAAIRAAVFQFDTVLEELEIPSLNLYKNIHSQAFSEKLDSLLATFADSPPAKLVT